MTTVEELKELRIEYPNEADIVGYKGIYNRFFKRVFDFILALIMVIVLSPVLLVVSALIIIDDGMPVFYRAQRGGYKNKTFRIFKFRSMVNNADEIVGGENADEMYEKYVLKNKNALRVKYAAEVSFKTDFKIFFKTVFDVINKAIGFLFKKEHRG